MPLLERYRVAIEELIHSTHPFNDDSVRLVEAWGLCLAFNALLDVKGETHSLDLFQKSYASCSVDNPLYGAILLRKVSDKTPGTTVDTLHIRDQMGCQIFRVLLQELRSVPECTREDHLALITSAYIVLAQKSGSDRELSFLCFESIVSISFTCSIRRNSRPIHQGNDGE